MHALGIINSLAHDKWDINANTNNCLSKGSVLAHFCFCFKKRPWLRFPVHSWSSSRNTFSKKPTVNSPGQCRAVAKLLQSCKNGHMPCANQNTDSKSTTANPPLKHYRMTHLLQCVRTTSYCQMDLYICEMANKITVKQPIGDTSYKARTSGR